MDGTGDWMEESTDLSRDQTHKDWTGRPLCGTDMEVCDDFKIHAPTREKLVMALNAFMDLSLRLGLICQKVKTTTPSTGPKVLRFYIVI